jgi:hypothetical protein
MAVRTVALAAAAVFIAASHAAATCHTALSLGIDVSDSIDADEHKAQREGTARALLHDAVWQRLIGARVHVYEWSSRDPVVIVPWTKVRSLADVEAIAAAVLAAPRPPRGGHTALGAAIAFGAAELAQHTDCTRRVLDISGDGPDNSGRRELRPEAITIPDDITVNAISVGGAYEPYFRETVSRGPLAFVVVARDWQDYARTLVRKLLMELS